MNIIAKDSKGPHARLSTLEPVKKFSDPKFTLDGSARAEVPLRRLTTLWFNTGTLCNLECKNCYIESSPSNDSLVYLSRSEVASYLNEISEHNLGVEEIGLTGGEPFMNPDIIEILDDALSAGFRVLLLTNAMRPMMKRADELLALRERYGSGLVIRVSIDHFDPALHQEERGPRSWQPMLKGLTWLAEHEFILHAAARTRWTSDEDTMRTGFMKLFTSHQIPIDAANPAELILFPEIDQQTEVPEISVDCWQTLGVHAEDMMCATSRMIVKRKGQSAPEVVACTLLPYEDEFTYKTTLIDSLKPVVLNHPSCAQFCVLGGGSCAQ